MPVTIHDLARLSGLNASTISRALRDDPRVRESTREKIHALALEHGYVPNLPARQLAAGRSGNLLFSFGSPQAAIELETAIALNDLFGAEYDLQLVLHGNSSARLKRQLEKLYQKAADGAMIIPPGDTELCARELTGLINHLPVPHLFIDRYWEGLECPIVTTDNATAVRGLVSCCAEWGAKEFYLSFPGGNPVARCRDEAAREELRRRKLAVVQQIEPGRKTAVLGNSCSDLPLPEGKVFCGGFFDALEQPASGHFENAVICRQNFPAIAARAAQLLRRMMKGRKVPGMSQIPHLEYLICQ